MKRLFGSIVLLLSILACGSAVPATPSQAELETIVATTLESLTAVAPTTQAQVNGTSIAIDNIAFSIPTEIGNGAESKLIEAVAPAEDVPWWVVVPAHHQYLLQGYPLQNKYHEPSIYVYPVEEFVQVNEDVAGLIEDLKTIINSPGQPLPEYLPLLPIFNAAQVFYAQVQIIPFQSGSGIRYITQYDQAPLPINNVEVFYTFQGLTSDGKYYVAAILPINNPLLTIDDNPNSITPEGGIPFDWDPNNFALLPAYIDSVTQLLNMSEPNSFNPTLSSLDQFIQSITVVSP